MEYTTGMEMVQVYINIGPKVYNWYENGTYVDYYRAYSLQLVTQWYRCILINGLKFTIGMQMVQV